jgi:hypothetical protein
MQETACGRTNWQIREDSYWKGFLDALKTGPAHSVGKNSFFSAC